MTTVHERDLQKALRLVGITEMPRDPEGASNALRSGILAYVETVEKLNETIRALNESLLALSTQLHRVYGDKESEVGFWKGVFQAANERIEKLAEERDAEADRE